MIVKNYVNGEGMAREVTKITDHYSKGNLLERLIFFLTEDNVNLIEPSIKDLAPYDHFHGRGIEATNEIAMLLNPVETDMVLDIGPETATAFR